MSSYTKMVGEIILRFTLDFMLECRFLIGCNGVLLLHSAHQVLYSRNYVKLHENGGRQKIMRIE